jgi:hypothetical protein
MKKRTLTELYAIREDGVARRALADIIAKAKESGRLSASESEWADQLTQSVKSSTGSSMQFPTLSLKGGRGSDTSMQRGAAAGAKTPKQPPAQPTELEPTQGSSDDISLGSAGGPGPKPVVTGTSLSKKSGRKLPSTNRFVQSADAENDVGNLGPAGNQDPAPKKASSIPPASPQKMAFDTSDIKDGPGNSLPVKKKSGKLSKLFNFGKKKAG